MSEETLVHFCSPTLAGIKTGNLFSCFFENRMEMNREIRKYNELLVPKGLCILSMGFDAGTGRGLIYLFRPSRLNQDLTSKEAVNILTQKGYTGSTAKMLGHLRKRISRKQEFPHEIGLFLSYPPEDVRGFMDEKATNYKCVGCWKVYGDEESARKKFRAFEACESVYAKCLANGMSLEHLAVKEVG